MIEVVGMHAQLLIYGMSVYVYHYVNDGEFFASVKDEMKNTDKIDKKPLERTS